MAIGFSIGIHSFTLVVWWKPVAVCAILAVPATLWLARHVRRLTRPIMNYLEYPFAYILSFSLLLGTFYGSNYFISDPTSAYEYKAPVIKKYSQLRKHTQKIGRRGYKEVKYHIYSIEIRMEDGKIKKIDKPLSEYNRIKKGSFLNLRIEKGLFSIPVIKNMRKTNHN